MECKYFSRYLKKGKRCELIDTLWNVNTGVQHTRWLPA